MFEIKITLDATSRLESAIDRLAEALSPSLSSTPAEESAAPANVVPLSIPGQEAVKPTPVPPAPPVTANPVPAVPISTAPSYTLEQVSTAGANLITDNPGKLPELQGLLAHYGVPAVAALKPEQLGAFATALRGLGANI